MRQATHILCDNQLFLGFGSISVCATIDINVLSRIGLLCLKMGLIFLYLLVTMAARSGMGSSWTFRMSSCTRRSSARGLRFSGEIPTLACGVLPRRPSRFSRRDRGFVNRHFSLRATRPELPLLLHPNVQAALNECRPVVALESTIIAHGLPFPQNLELAHRLDLLFHKYGVESATIAINEGVCKVGLSAEEMEDLARPRTGEPQTAKCSSRDIALLLARQQLLKTKSDPADKATVSVPTWGATTVASTMVIAHAAGIPVFVTGGIGGVHRYGQDTLDVSADLIELGRTQVIVVSAGIKSILDIPRTLQVLETQGVPTVAYQTDEFPAFFSPRSGVAAPARLDTPEEIASAFWAAKSLGLNHGMLVAVPNYNPAGEKVELAINTALREADETNIVGPAVTPFLLKRISELTDGDSLRSNLSLVEANAMVGAEIAVAIASRNAVGMAISRPKSRVVVVGGAVKDIVAKPFPGAKLALGTSNPGSCIESDGGVGRNVAEVLGRLGMAPIFFTSVGRDDRGKALIDRLTFECGVHTSESTIHRAKDVATATYVAILDEQGDLHAACADMRALEGIKAPPMEVLEQADFLVIDANPPMSVLRETSRRALEAGTCVVFEPTSSPKAAKVALDDEFMSSITYSFPNLDEVAALAHFPHACRLAWNPNDRSSQQQVELAAERCLDRMRKNEAYLVITMGKDGVLLAHRKDGLGTRFDHFPIANDAVHVRNTTGAGDSLCGAAGRKVGSGRCADRHGSSDLQP
jgi:pseudouridine-5'-phosphate glycosidase/sugar/nucleoside kinase (ribokinase family)